MNPLRLLLYDGIVRSNERKATYNDNMEKERD